MSAATRLRPLLLLLGALLILPGAARGPELRAWKIIENTAEDDDPQDLLSRTRAYLEDFPDGEHTLEAHRLAGGAAFALEDWAGSRRHLETWLTQGGRDGLDEVKLMIALSVSEGGDRDGGASQLRNVVSSARELDVVRRAARELVALHLFDGAWSKALDAQALLLGRGAFEPDIDLEDSRAAIAAARRETKRPADALQTIEHGVSNPVVAGLVGVLALEEAGQLVDGPKTEDARRSWAVRYPEHPLIGWVPGAERFAAAPEDVDPKSVGVLLPLTGRYAAPGLLARRGIELAMETAAKLGWPKVKVTFVDSAGEPDRAGAGVRSLVADQKVIAVIGPIITASAPAVAAAATDVVVPTVMMVQKAEQGAQSAFAFNAWMHPDAQVRAVVEHAMGRMGLKRFAIAYPDKESAGELVATFWTEVEKAGGQIVSVESYPAESTDFRETGRRLKGGWYRANPPGEGDGKLPWLGKRRKPQLAEPITDLVPGVDFEAIFVPDNYRRVSMLAPGFIFEEINLGGHIQSTRDKTYPAVTLLGGSALNHPDLIARGGKYTEGTVLVDGFFLGSSLPEVKEFTDAYRKLYKEDPTILEATAYDTMLFVLQLLSEGVSTRRELVKRLALSTPVRSITGARGFDPSGGMVHELLTLQVNRGAIVQVWPRPPEAATGGKP